MSEPDKQHKRDGLARRTEDAWLAGDWDTAIELAEQLTKFDRATGMAYQRISLTHKQKGA